MQYEKAIRKLLWSFGVNRRYRGFDQVAYGLELSINDISRLEHITKDLYPDIAKRFHTSRECVERNIRTLEDNIWEYGNRKLLQKISPMSLESKPTSTIFFKILTEYLLSLYKELNIESSENT